MRKYFKLFLKNRVKVVLFLWCAFFLWFAGLHLYTMHRYMLYRISAAYSRVRNGKKFNDGCDKRATLMELPLKHVKDDALGIYVRYPQVKDQDIANIASIGFVTYYFYPIPVHYLEESSIKECDYLISRNGFSGRYRRFLRINEEEGNFKKIAGNKDYILMEREGGAGSQ